MMIDLLSLGSLVDYRKRKDGLYNAWVRIKNVTPTLVDDATMSSSEWVVVDVVDDNPQIK